MISKPSGRGWVMVLTAALGVTVSFGSVVVFSFGVFLKPLGREFGWTRGQVSLAFSLAALSVAACSPLLGRLVDRVGARRVILVCVSVYGLAFSSLALLRGALWRLYAAYIVIGVVGNGTTQLSYSKVITAWFDRRRGLALALMMAGVGCGAIVVPPATAWLIGSAGWRGAYLVLGGAILLIGLAPAALFLRERPPGGRAEVRAADSPAAEGGTPRQAVRTRALWETLAAFFLFSASVNGSITHLVPMLTDRGIAIGAAAFAVSVLGAATLGGRLLTGALLDRYFGGRVAAALFAVAACGVLVAGRAHSVAAAYCGAGLIGLGMGAEADVLPYLISRYFGLRSFSELFGYVFSAYAIAGALGPWLMGRAFDRFHSYATALPVLGAAMFLSALLMFLLPPYESVKRV